MSKIGRKPIAFGQVKVEIKGSEIHFKVRMLKAFIFCLKKFRRILTKGSWYYHRLSMKIQLRCENFGVSTEHCWPTSFLALMRNFSAK